MSNEFNATSFYGFDEEEEEEEDLPQQGENEVQQPRDSGGQGDSNPNELPSSRQITGVATSGNVTVSGNQLLALFGAVPPTSHSSQSPVTTSTEESHLKNASHSSQDPPPSASKEEENKKESSHSSQPLVTTTSTEESHHKNASHSSQDPSPFTSKEEENNQESSMVEFEFTLPPASQSSSDESSQED
jgi:hypothetical protein